MENSIPDSREPGEYSGLSISNSPFVELVKGMEIDVKMQYPLMGMENAEKQCFMRKKVYERLLAAQEMLPKGISIRILDAWRPFELQKELFFKYSETIIKKFHLEHASEAEQKKIIRKYISEPIKNQIYAPVHTTGGAVDITLINESGDELNMGTAFDDFSEKTHTCYYENGQDIEIRDNRRILYNAMIKAGFTNLPSEWWHFDYGDSFWAHYTKKKAIYEGVFAREGLY